MPKGATRRCGHAAPPSRRSLWGLVRAAGEAHKKVSAYKTPLGGGRRQPISARFGRKHQNSLTVSAVQKGAAFLARGRRM